MPDRPLHATLLPTGPRLFDLLADALAGSGPALLPLDPNLPVPQLRALLDALRPAAIVQPDGLRPLGDRAPVGENTAVVIATSGSTGEPKGVELTAGALMHSARAGLAHLNARRGDRWLCCLPTHHIAGLQVLVRSIVSQTEPVLHQRFDVDAVLNSARDGVAAFTSLVPTMLRRMIDAGADLSAFRSILLGGSATSPALLDEARASGGSVVATYGMSETCGGCVYDGVPLDGVEVAADHNGRILIAGPVLFTRYRLRADLTAAAWDGRWLATQDIGRLVDGRLQVLGRRDDVINTGGEKVIAGEVAELLTRHNMVKDAVVFGRSDREWGERVCAVVVPTDPDRRPSLAQLRAFVAQYIPPYCAPHELAVIDTMPLLPSGKPDRNALRRGTHR